MVGAVLVVLAAAAVSAQTITTRPYWVVDPAVYATAGSVHTHVQVTGWVAYTRWEDDGDLHIKLVPTRGAYSPFLIAECIPRLPCARPVLDARITVRGISRTDPEHNGWKEIHPVESWVAAP